MSIVKCFTSTDAGAPKLMGAAGSLIALLDACLVTGFNVQAVSKVEWASNVAKVTTNNPHGFSVGQVVEISGALVDAFNAQFKITAATSNTFSFGIEGSYQSSISGTISAKRAPVGWDKTYAGINKAAYKSKDLSSKGFLLRVDDADARYSRVRGYESMDDIDNGFNLFPTVLQIAVGLTWTKASTAGAVSEWVLIADSRFFYFLPNSWGGVTACVYWYGDLADKWTGDLFNVSIQGSINPAQSNPQDSINVRLDGMLQGRYLARASHGVGSSVQSGLFGSAMQLSPGYGAAMPFPNPSGQMFICAPITAHDSTKDMRGVMPGLYQPLHHQPLNHKDVITSVVFNGEVHKVMILEFATDTVISNNGRLAIDVEGAWR